MMRSNILKSSSVKVLDHRDWCDLILKKKLIKGEISPLFSP
jgi:hypothetical protein